MNTRGAQKRLLRLHLLHHASKSQIKELVESAVPIHRILSLYPFDYAEYASYLERWLANVPASALKTQELLLPRSVYRWQPQGKLDSWFAYLDHGAINRHRELAKTHFPVNKSKFPFENFLINMHDALWFLANWDQAVARCEEVESRELLTHFVQVWSDSLCDQRTYSAILKLDLRTKSAKEKQ